MSNRKVNMVWHYTILPKVKKIERDHVLKPFGTPGQIPAVWFSEDQEWEPTAACNWIGEKTDGSRNFLDRDGLYRAHGGLYRIGVRPDDAPLTWEQYKLQIHITVQSAMLDGAKALGANPEKWRASTVEVPEKKWLAVQMWNGDEWIDCTRK